MKIKLLFLASLFLISGNLYSQPIDSVATVLYIDQYKELAIQTKNKYNIPASLILAQAILMTRGGTNHLATNAKNHFGNTCTSSDVNNRYYQNNNTQNVCFRKYNTPEESYEDYLKILKSKSMYNPLFSLSNTDYQTWLIKLKDLKHSAKPDYVELILGIIEKYNLAQYDLVNSGELIQQEEVKEIVRVKDVIEEIVVITEPQEEIATTVISSEVAPQTLSPILKIPVKTFTLEPYQLKRTFSTFTKRQTYEYNGVKLILAQKEDTYKKIAEEMQLSERVIRTYNDIYDPTVDPIEGEVVYIQQKNKKSLQTTHTIVEGEPLRYIAQKYTLRLRLILKINNLYDIGPGTTLLLPSKNR